MAEAYQELAHLEEAAVFIRDNLEMHNDSIKTYILLMQDALYGQRFNNMRKAGLKAEEIMARLNPSISGDFIRQYFRNQVIDVINETYQVKNIPHTNRMYAHKKKIDIWILKGKGQNIITNTTTEKDGVILKNHKYFIPWTIQEHLILITK
jgi:hypothetical protein